MVLVTLGPGEALGELSLVDGGPRPASAEALSTVALMITRPVLLDLATGTARRALHTPGAGCLAGSPSRPPTWSSSTCRAGGRCCWPAWRPSAGPDARGHRAGRVPDRPTWPAWSGRRARVSTRSRCSPVAATSRCRDGGSSSTASDSQPLGGHLDPVSGS